MFSKIYAVKSDAGRKRGTKSTAKLNLRPFRETSSCCAGYVRLLLVGDGIPATIMFTMQGRHMSHDPAHKVSTLLPTQNR